MSQDMRVMGVINITPDSFSDGNKYNCAKSCFNQCEYLLNNGVDFLDVGAESTAPHNCSISFDEEKNRLGIILDILPKLKSKYQFELSLDSYRPDTVEWFLKETTTIFPKGEGLYWNDVSGIWDHSVEELIRGFDRMSYIMGHTFIPDRGHVLEHMDYVKEEIDDPFDLLTIRWGPILKRVQELDLGKRIWWDPCFGFSKNFEQNEALLNFFCESSCSLPINQWVLGISRKSFLKKRILLNNPSLAPRDLFFACDEAQKEWTRNWSKGLLKKKSYILRVHSPSLFSDSGTIRKY